MFKNRSLRGLLILFSNPSISFGTFQYIDLSDPKEPQPSNSPKYRFYQCDDKGKSICLEINCSRCGGNEHIIIDSKSSSKKYDCPRYAPGLMRGVCFNDNCPCHEIDAERSKANSTSVVYSSVDTNIDHTNCNECYSHEFNASDPHPTTESTDHDSTPVTENSNEENNDTVTEHRYYHLFDF